MAGAKRLWHHIWDSGYAMPLGSVLGSAWSLYPCGSSSCASQGVGVNYRGKVAGKVLSLSYVVMPGLGLLAAMAKQLNSRVFLPLFFQVHPFLITTEP